MKDRFRLLASPGFLWGLAILLLNDWYLKPVFHNWVTGKLSDFAGLFIFPLFWMAFFPAKKHLIGLLTAGLFIFWKMPLSQPLLDAWNTLGVWPMARTTDAGDLWALSMIPLSIGYASNAGVSVIPRWAPLTLAVLAFAATSFVAIETFNKPYDFNCSESTLRQRMAADSVWRGLAHFLTAADPDTLRMDSRYVPTNYVWYNYTVKVDSVGERQTRLTLLNALCRTRRSKELRQNMLGNFENVLLPRIQDP